MRQINDKEQAYQAMCDVILPEIDTWEDMYAMLDDKLEHVRTALSAMMAIDMLLLMYCIFQAMRDLPEEGDIKEIMRRAIRILTVEGHDRFGIEIAVLVAGEGDPMDADANETATSLRAKGITLQ